MQQLSLSTVTVSNDGIHKIPIAAHAQIDNNTSGYVTVTTNLLYNDINSNLVRASNTYITGLMIY